MLSQAFDLSRLSAREEAILEAAIEGLTDVQIASRLEISQSTVNSYWVRIRGKLGQLSRTEMVALALKQKAQNAMAGMMEKQRAFEEQIASHTQQSYDTAYAEIHHAALRAMPEAVLVLDGEGKILFANARLAAIFGYEVGELLEQSIMTLLPRRTGGTEQAAIKAYLERPMPVRIGVDRVIYGRRRDGREFRVLLLLDSDQTPAGTIVTCVVRDFVTEIGMRRDFAATQNSN